MRRKHHKPFTKVTIQSLHNDLSLSRVKSRAASKVTPFKTWSNNLFDNKLTCYLRHLQLGARHKEGGAASGREHPCLDQMPPRLCQVIFKLEPVSTLFMSVLFKSVSCIVMYLNVMGLHSNWYSLIYSSLHIRLRSGYYYQWNVRVTIIIIRLP